MWFAIDVLDAVMWLLFALAGLGLIHHAWEEHDGRNAVGGVLVVVLCVVRLCFALWR